MEEYPEEIRTPPVSLVALIGCTDYHSLISSHLHSEQPPINTLALPDFSKLSLLLASNDNKPHPLTAATSDRSAVAGILKKDWLLKHRTKIPAVVAALFSSDQLFADSAQWLQVSSDLDNLKSLIRPKNIKLAVVVLHSSSDEISEDRMTALRKQAELDSKYLVVFNPNEVSQLEQSLNRITGVFAELSNIYYRDEGKRIKTSVEKKNSNSNELNVRYCFKVAVYAEFRRDWAEALRFYEDAYHILREMIGTATRLPVIQRLVEIKTVAEQLHFKISTLLLHGGKLGDAVMWFRRHITSYRKLVGLSEAVFLHWEWMSRQYLVFAELLETSSKSMQGNLFPALGTGDNALTEWEFQPAYYYQLAAHYLKEKRNSLEVALSMSVPSDEMDNNAESVVPSIYVGQFARLLEEGDAAATQVLTDEEYTQYAISEGKRFQDSFEIIALLKKSQDLFSSVKSHRMSSLCGFQMAREYFTVGDFSNAKQIFDGVANIYRQEGWVTLLWEALGYLRECSRKSGMTHEFVEYSLEMAALPVLSSSSGNQFKITECGPAGPASLEQREIIHAEVFGLVGGAAKLVQDEKNNNLKFSRDHPLHLEIDLVSPLRLALLASVAFHEQVIKPGVPTLFTLSLLTQLPLPVEIDQLEVQFNQSECNFIIANSQKSISAAVSKSQLLWRVETAPSLDLVTNKWQRFTYEIKSELAGKLECTYVIAKTGPHFTICCRAESPASMDALPLWKFEDRLETFPTKDPSLSFSGQKAVQVEELDPQVDLILGATGPALAGECFYVPVTVASKGHSVFSGELKFNLVDAGGGGLFSPSRETEPFSSDSHHVELVGIALPEEDESQSSPDKIDKLQDSFGLVSVPTLEAGESWSCRLQIKWHRPKPIMLYASLGYFSGSSEAPSQKVRVHRSMQIEGKTPVVLSHNLMLPFRRDSLLLSKLKLNPGTNQLASIPLNETSILVVTAKNCSEVPLKIQSLSIDAAEGTERSFVLLNGDKELQVPAKLLPGEEFKKVFTVRPEEKISKFHLGSVSLRWRRDSVSNDQSASATTDSWVLTKHQLSEINVELPLLVVNLECPPYAILGDPFTYLVKIQNHTQLLQEVKFSLADAQPFVSSGSHSDTIFILPKSVYTLRYMVVPLASGMHQLPRVTITSVRYSAGFQPSAAATSVFVFPSKPQFKLDDTADKVKKPMLADTV